MEADAGIVQSSPRGSFETLDGHEIITSFLERLHARTHCLSHSAARSTSEGRSEFLLRAFGSGPQSEALGPGTTAASVSGASAGESSTQRERETVRQAC